MKRMKCLALIISVLLLLALLSGCTEQRIEAIRDVLMAADAIRCDVESYEPELHASNALYHIPAGYCVQVDYNKLATAIYQAGYRKENKQ